MDKPMDVLHGFPVRKTRKQKEAFRTEVLAYAKSLGYEAHTEKGTFGVQNVVIGDQENARYVVTAHYDTCARLPLPNLITPCSLALFTAWQLLLVVILCVPIGVISGFVGAWIGDYDAVVILAYLLLFVELGLMLFGPANRHNSNDNTSGVVTLLETAGSMPLELRGEVCFVLFDLEEGGLLGSAAYRRKHRAATSKQLILNLDCVGDGNEILLFPTGNVKRDRARIQRLKTCCFRNETKSIAVKDRGFSVYPSDQSNFPNGIGIAAFCRSEWAGLYLAKIHTDKDRNLDENNVALLRDYLIAIIRAQA